MLNLKNKLKDVIKLISSDPKLALAQVENIIQDDEFTTLRDEVIDTMKQWVDVVKVDHPDLEYYNPPNSYFVDIDLRKGVTKDEFLSEIKSYLVDKGFTHRVTRFGDDETVWYKGTYPYGVMFYLDDPDKPNSVHITKGLRLR